MEYAQKANGTNGSIGSNSNGSHASVGSTKSDFAQPDLKNPAERADPAHVQEVVRQAHQELRVLLQQRADVMKRIGTVKQTIAGLADMFGDEVLNDELLELVDRKSSGRQPGFTKACRMILMQAGQAMSAREISDYLRNKMPEILARHKDPMASVTTVLNRLVDYGEAQAVMANGRRAWRWVAETNAQPAAKTTASLVSA